MYHLPLVFPCYLFHFRTLRKLFPLRRHCGGRISSSQSCYSPLSISPVDHSDEQLPVPSILIITPPLSECCAPLPLLKIRADDKIISIMYLLALSVARTTYHPSPFCIQAAIRSRPKLRLCLHAPLLASL